MNEKNSKFIVYSYIMSHKNPDKFTPKLIKRHIDYLKKLDKQKRLIMCGPFLNYKGGMVIIKAKSVKEAGKIAENDPFIKSGFETYELKVWQLACKENSYLA